ncbi:MAG: hypothetical protein V4548_14015 [Bacteroidota bacterium]
MIDRKKKYKTQPIDAYPHIGKLLNHHIENHHINKTQLSQQLGIASSNISDYTKRESLQLGIIWKISLALKHNFMAVLAEAMPVPYATKKELELTQQVMEQKELIKDLQKELEVYSRILEKKGT